jgi:acetyl-CoA carboxylase biotin carboxyl carrier protein
MSTTVRAEMAATVWKVLAREGDVVGSEDVLLVLESMKMEIPVLAETGGTVRSLPVAEGALVQEGDVLAVLDQA